MDDDLQPPRNFALLAAVFEGGLAVAAVGVGWLLGQWPLESFPRTLAGAGWGAGWGAAATVPPLALFWLGVNRPIGPFARLIRVVDELLVPLFRDCRIMDLAVISALAGLGEEMLFRGVIQQAVAGWLDGATGEWIGLAVAALLFAAAHMITATYALLAGILGLYLGWLWMLTENLLVPITIHAMYDFLALVYLVKVRRQGSRIANS